MLSAAQRHERARGIGSSDAGAVVGVNPYRSAVDVYLEKTGAVAPPDLSDNQAVHFGNVLEGVIADEYARRTGRRVRRRHQSFRHRAHAHMIAHPDRTVDGQRLILECKTAGAHTAGDWGPDGSDDVPDAYLIQVLHQMIVMDYPRADLAVLIGGRDFRIYHLAYDPALAELVIEREARFWRDHVLAGQPPAPAHTRDLQSLYPADSGYAQLASAAAIDACQRLQAVRAQVKASAERERGLKYAIQAEMGDAAALVDDAGQTLCTWKKAKDTTRLDAKALAAEHPNLHRQFCTAQPGARRFVVK